MIYLPDLESNLEGRSAPLLLDDVIKSWQQIGKCKSCWDWYVDLKFQADDKKGKQEDLDIPLRAGVRGDNVPNISVPHAWLASCNSFWEALQQTSNFWFARKLGVMNLQGSLCLNTTKEWAFGKAALVGSLPACCHGPWHVIPKCADVGAPIQLYTGFA